MLPFLWKLQIPCSSGDLLESIGPVLKDTKYFTELQVIELYEPKLDLNLSCFILQNRPLRLQTIKIVCNEITSAEALHAFLSALEHGNTHTSLRNLTLQYRRLSKQRMTFLLNSKIVVDWSIIQPFARFPKSDSPSNSIFVCVRARGRKLARHGAGPGREYVGSALASWQDGARPPRLPSPESSISSSSVRK